jgi:Kef-type K+ transport system membrane component KefB
VNILSPEAAYVALLFVLFVVPRVLQRYRIPSAVTALAFGVIAGVGLSLFQGDGTVALLSTLGIVSLFLFAGLDVDGHELRREWVPIVTYVALFLTVLAIVTTVFARVVHFDVRSSVLIALALLTPSTGFILDSLGGWGLSEQERFWIRSKAIAAELIALSILFVVLQSTSFARLGWSSLALVGMVALLPLIFRGFAKAILPYAPKSEFGLLMLVAAMCALITHRLGVYYLVGAFVTGMIAQQSRGRLPALSSGPMLGAVEAFASLFVPFYFFHAGLELHAEDFSVAAMATGLGLCAVMLPLRVWLVAIHRRLRFGEPWDTSVRVGVPMLPTTVFTLVLAEILRERFHAPPAIFGGLIVYAVVNTLLPGLLLRAATPGFEDELQLAGAAPARPKEPAPTEHASA